MFKFLGVITLFALVGAWAAEDRGPLRWQPDRPIMNLNYESARHRLIREGATPVVQNASFSALGRCGIGRQRICIVYPEAEACSSTGLAMCRFNWRAPNGQRFDIITQGEQATRLTTFAMEYN